MVVKGGVRGGNTFADLEANVVPVNRVDGGRWKDHFGRFRGGGLKVWKDKGEDKAEVKKLLSTRWSKQDDIYFCAASEWPSASGASLLQELAVETARVQRIWDDKPAHSAVDTLPLLRMYDFM
jgi:hypothetical protein